MTLMAMVLIFIAASQSHAVGFWRASTFAECDHLLHDRPGAYSCYRVVARGNQGWVDGIRHLEGRLTLHPRDHLARLALGVLEADIFDDRAEVLMRSAIAGRLKAST